MAAVHLETRYVKLYTTAMGLWDRNGEEYRTILQKYEDALLEKRALNLAPLNTIPKTILEDFPQVDFLEIEDEEAASEYLLELSECRLSCLITEIEVAMSSYVMNTLRNRIADFKYEARRYHCPRHPLALDPDYRAGKSSRVTRVSRSLPGNE